MPDLTEGGALRAASLLALSFFVIPKRLERRERLRPRAWPGCVARIDQTKAETGALLYLEVALLVLRGYSFLKNTHGFHLV